MRLPVYSWHSIKGTLTEDNRDCCGILEASDVSLCILADGVTNSPNSGALAKALVEFVLSCCVSDKDSITPDGLIETLKKAQEFLRKKYPADSASYIVVVFDGVNCTEMVIT